MAGKMDLNVNRKVTDIYYRYKMPRLLVKFEGRGNGVNSVIENLDAVAKALGRPPNYIAKYFGYSVGTRVRFKGNQWILNGKHDVQNLQDALYGFIDHFVLCSLCENPETVLDALDKELFQRCMACGHKGKVKEHQLVQYIIKNPEQEDISTTGVVKNVSQRNKKKQKMSNNESFKLEKTVCFNSKQTQNDEDDDDDWALDVSKEAVKARREELSNSVKNLCGSNSNV